MLLSISLMFFSYLFVFLSGGILFLFIWINYSSSLLDLRDRLQKFFKGLKSRNFGSLVRELFSRSQKKSSSDTIIALLCSRLTEAKPSNKNDIRKVLDQFSQEYPKWSATLNIVTSSEVRNKDTYIVTGYTPNKNSRHFKIVFKEDVWTKSHAS